MKTDELKDVLWRIGVFMQFAILTTLGLKLAEVEAAGLPARILAEGGLVLMLTAIILGVLMRVPAVRTRVDGGANDA